MKGVKMNKKRIISIIVALIIGTHLFIPSYALCESYNNTLIKVDFDHALENELEKWKEGIYDDPSDVKTDSIKNIYKT